MKEFQQTLETPSYLCDRHDRLHIWAAIRLCQEVSEYHSNATGVGYEELLKQNRAWVISRAYYVLYRRPASFEKIMLSTWSRGNDGLFAFRDYLVKDAAGETVMTGTSYWPLIDFTNRRAVRLKEIIENYEINPVEATNHSVLDKLRLPPMDNPDDEFRYKVRLSMIDHTQHVNNSEYVKLIFDSLADTDFDLDIPFAIELNYQHETHLDDTLSVSRIQDNDSIWIQIRNSRGLSVASRISHIIQ